MQIEEISEKITALVIELEHVYNSTEIGAVLLAISQELLLKDLSKEAFLKMMLLVIYKSIDVPNN